MPPETGTRRVLMVCTRDIPPQGSSGRENTMAFIRDTLAASGEVKAFRLYSLFEQRSLRRALAIVLRGAWALLTGRPQPLQLLLFFDRRTAAALEKAVAACQAQVVYFDGVRSGQYASGLRRLHPQLRLVCDFDDLMSSRMGAVAEAGAPISIGYLKAVVPGWVQRHVLAGAWARAIPAYEHKALLRAEREIAQACDRVVLVSGAEARVLSETVAGAPVQVIAPVLRPVRGLVLPLHILRFVFIGSDSLLQNRKSIEYLVALWQRCRPGVPLHIFGRQGGHYPEVQGLVFRGYVEDLAMVYEPGNVLLAPSFQRGGVKTKVLEAMAWGVVPVGNATTFEGIDADTSGLALEESALVRLIEEPAASQMRLGEQGRKAIEEATRAHAGERLAGLWRQTVWPPA